MSKKIGELLIEHGLVTQGQLGDALQAQMIFGGRLGTNLVELGYLSERRLAEFLSTQLGFPSVTAAEIDAVSKETLSSVSAEVASSYFVFPLSLSGRRLRLAMVDPTDLTALDEIRFKTGFTIQPAVAPEVLVVYALERHYEIPRPTRYLRLDRSTEAEMIEAHRAGTRPALDILDHPRRTAPQPPNGISAAQPVGGEAAALEAAAAQLVEATEHGQVLEILRDVLARDFVRVAVFGIRGTTAVGWLQAGLDRSDEDLRRMSFSLEEEGLSISHLVAERVPRLARIGDSATELRLLETIGASPAHELLFLPVSVGSEARLFAVCDELRAGLAWKSIGFHERLSRKVGAALQMLNYRKQILAT